MAAVPILFVLFIVSINFEGHLFSNPSIESFDYLYEARPDVLDEKFSGEIYYDDLRNALILDVTEYPPETIDNPEHYSGLKRIGAMVFELFDAYSGSNLLMTEELIEDIPVPFFGAIAYGIKSLIWIILSYCISRKRIES